MPKKLPLPSRTTRVSDVFQSPEYKEGKAKYDPEQESASDAHGDMLRKRISRDIASGRRKDPMYEMSDARELEKLANAPERGFGPTLAKRELLKRSNEREFAAPDYGDQGQFLKKGGKVSSASSRGDGIAKRGKTKGRMC